MEGDILMRKKTLTKKQYQENIEKIAPISHTKLLKLNYEPFRY